jgi:Zn-dependent protease with chaperone function
MRAPLLVFGYTVVLAWVLPLPLRRLAGAGLSPRLGLTAWLTALGSVLGCTSGALAVLDSGQLTAVLRHERAHLAGRHHLLLAITRSLAAILPGVPLFERAGTEVTRLAEMRADDVAARHGERRTLLSALLTMGAGPAAGSAPAAWLAATGGVIAARMHRLANPPARARSLAQGLALVILTAAIVAASALVPVFALAGV